jgi:hypothetical protein
MSLGGPFTLVTNQGKLDQLLYQQDVLNVNRRMWQERNLPALRRKYPGMSDEQLKRQDEAWPPMWEIEKTHVVFTNFAYKPFAAIAAQYSKNGSIEGLPTLGTSCSFRLPQYGEFTNDCVLYVKLTGFSAVNALDKVRYTELLGHRLAKKVTFKISTAELDSYGTERYNVNYQFKLPSQKQTGYLRDIGQEIPKTGFLTADPAVDEVREYRFFGDGPQTFKQTQPTLELYIPILFWFKDIQHALPNFLIANNMPNIEIVFEAVANLIAYADYGGGGAYNSPVISECSMYCNNLYVSQDMHHNIAARFTHSLIRVNRIQTQRLTSSTGSIHLAQLKWPLEAVYVGFRPVSNYSNTQKWWRNVFLTDQSVKEAVVTGVSTIQVNNAIYYAEDQPTSAVSMRVSDVVLHPSLPPNFYSSYIPYQFGTTLATPKDMGWLMFNFSRCPGLDQPSGHFNSSHGRELYLDYISNIAAGAYLINSASPVDLIVIADCINILRIERGNVILAFST